MKAFITAARVRALLTDARTEKDAADILRAHRVRYSYSTTGGVLHIRIPARAGCITVTRTASRNHPLTVAAAVPGAYPYPLPIYSWDD